MSELISMEVDETPNAPSPFTSECDESYLKNLLYPCVPDDVRLPMSLTAQEQSNRMKLADNNLRVEYIGEGTEDSHAATVRTVNPIPSSCGIYYFEVTIENKGHEGYIGIGLCASSVSLNKLPGWEKNSFGYHGDDGCTFKGSGVGQQYGPTFGSFDTIGCCYNLADGTVFYTKNGVHQGIAFNNLFELSMYPAVGLRSQGEVVVVNLGTSAPFIFDIESYIRDCKTTALNTIRQVPTSAWAALLQSPVTKGCSSTVNHNETADGPLPTSPPSHNTASVAPPMQSSSTLLQSTAASNSTGIVTPSTDSAAVTENATNSLLNRLVLAYMCHNGYSKTADAFAKQTGTELTESIASIVARQKIMSSIRSGKINEAIAATTEAYERDYNIFDENPKLLFRLKVRTFIEIIAGRTVNPDNMTSLNEILTYGKELQQEADNNEELGEQERKDMANAFSLMAYRDPSASCLAHLLAEEGRDKLADELNICILKCLGLPRANPIVLLLRQVEVCLSTALERDIAAAALVSAAWTIAYIGAHTEAFGLGQGLAPSIYTMSGPFRLEGAVSDLFLLLNNVDVADPINNRTHQKAESIVRYLSSYTTPAQATPSIALSAVRSLTSRMTDGERSHFNRTYHDLKQRGARETDSFLNLLNKIASDDAMLKELNKSCSANARDVDDLRRLCNNSQRGDYGMPDLASKKLTFDEPQRSRTDVRTRANVALNGTTYATSKAERPANGESSERSDGSHQNGNIVHRNGMNSQDKISSRSAISDVRSSNSGDRKAYNGVHKDIDRRRVGGSGTNPGLDSPISSRENRGERAEVVSSIGNLPSGMQEVAIVEDLLFVMVGVQGKYVRLAEAPRRGWVVDTSLDSSLAELTMRVLPLCEHFASLDQYTSSIDYGTEVALTKNTGRITATAPDLGLFPSTPLPSRGSTPVPVQSTRTGRVEHAIRGTIDEILKEYLILVAQFEHQFNIGQLTLQRLWYLVQDVLRTLGLVANIVSKIRKFNLRGGGILTLLHDETIKCYKESPERGLLEHLTSRAARPYLTTLARWLYEGIIDDPFNEFMIQEAPRHNNRTPLSEEDYWAHKYVTVENMSPGFLLPVIGKIKNAGKYLNVVSNHGLSVQCPTAGPIVYTTDVTSYIRDVEQAYDFASKQLLSLLMGDLKIMSHMRSIKLFFLMERGDLFEHFMISGRAELDRPRADIHEEVLDSLLSGAIASSTAVTDPNRDLLRVRLRSESFFTQLSKILSVRAVSPTKVSRNSEEVFLDMKPLTGFGALSFEYKAPWPLTLVLNRTALIQYTLLSRHLFYCKGLESQLSQTWMLERQSKMQIVKAVCPRAFGLRQQMLQFVQSLLYFTQCEVIEPLWKDTELKLTHASTTLDDVFLYHNQFLDRCITQAMLSSELVLKNIYKLLIMCVDFPSMFTSLLKGTRDESHIAWYDHTERIFTEHLNALIGKLKAVSNLNQDGERAASFLRSLEYLTETRESQRLCT
eukprot:CFRG7043T1